MRQRLFRNRRSTVREKEKVKALSPMLQMMVTGSASASRRSMTVAARLLRSQSLDSSSGVKAIKFAHCIILNQHQVEQLRQAAVSGPTSKFAVGIRQRLQLQMLVHHQYHQHVLPTNMSAVLTLLG